MLKKEFANASGRFFNLRFVGKSSPYRSVEKMFMIGCRQQNSLGIERVDVLQKAYDNALQFPEFMLIISKFCNRIKLIQKQNARSSHRMLEKASKILGGASKI